jgi:hypothetical protein
VSHERPLGRFARATATHEGDDHRADESGSGGRPAFRIRVQRFHECYSAFLAGILQFVAQGDRVGF